MDNGHSLAKLQILCAPPNVFARFFAPAGVFRPWRRPTAGYSLQRLRCGGPCAPVLWPQSGAAGANGRRGGARPVRCRKKRETSRRKRGRIAEKFPPFFRKARNARRAVGRTRLAPSCFVAIGREPCVRKRGVPPAVCLCRRLRCGEIAVIRGGESESPLVRFDAKA